MTGYPSKKKAASAKTIDEFIEAENKKVSKRYGYVPKLHPSEWQDNLAQPAQESAAWATKEDFYRELDRRVERMRKEMEIKTVTMRCKDYDVALNIVDMYGGHVVVGQVSFPPQRTWVGMPEDEKEKFVIAYYPSNWDRKTAVALMNNYEAYLKEKNT